MNSTNPPIHTDLPPSPTPVPVGHVLVSPDSKGKFTLRIETSQHRLSADEPKSMGGDDSAPSPYEFLLSGLGSCTAMTFKMYAFHKKLELGDFHIALSHHRDENKNLVIEKELIFQGEWDDEQIDKLVDISKKCPMHKDLSSAGITINTLTTKQG